MSKMLVLYFLGFVFIFATTHGAPSLDERKRALLNELESLLNDKTLQGGNKKETPRSLWKKQKPGFPWKNDKPGFPWKNDKPGFPWKNDKPGFPWKNDKPGFPWSEKDTGHHYTSLQSTRDVNEVTGPKREGMKDNVASAWKKVVDSLRNFVEVSKKEVGPISHPISSSIGRGGDASNLDNRKRALLVEIKSLLGEALGKNTAKRGQPPTSPDTFVWKKEYAQPTTDPDSLVWVKKQKTQTTAGPDSFVWQKKENLYKRLVNDLNGLFHDTTDKIAKKSVQTNDSKLKGLNDDLAELVKSTA